MIGGSAQDLPGWTPDGRPPRRRPGRIVYWVLVAISVALVAAGIGIVAATTRQYTDPATSMEQTLTPGDHLLTTLGQNVRRGDIVILHDPRAPGSLLVKRVIGLPGDHLTCCDAQGRVSVNGKPLDETYVYPGVAPSKISFSVTLGPGRVWVMGDNRNVSEDSREWGPVASGAIVGRVFAKGGRVAAATVRTPQTYVTDGLAPQDHRVPPFVWAALLVTVGVVALIVLAIVGIIRSAARRSRARRQPPPGYQPPSGYQPPPGYPGYGPQP
jgi:signal peptidase I